MKRKKQKKRIKQEIRELERRRKKIIKQVRKLKKKKKKVLKQNGRLRKQKKEIAKQRKVISDYLRFRKKFEMLTSESVALQKSGDS